MSTLGIDFTRPNVARVYDVLAGGRNNYAADREQAERLLEICPRCATRSGRTGHSSPARSPGQPGRGHGQFPDVGTGTPVRPPVGDAARAVIPGARIAYIDHDPIVIAIARALLADDEGTAARRRGPDRPCGGARPRRTCARSSTRRSPCASSSAWCSASCPPGRPATAVAGYADLIAPGSYVVISCARMRRRGTAEAVQPGVHRRRLVQPLAGRGERVPRRPRARPARARRGAELALAAGTMPVTPPGPAYVLAGSAKKTLRPGLAQSSTSRQPSRALVLHRA